MGNKIVTFGELMLRFSKEDKKRLSQGRMFCGNYGGSEANVAVSLAMQGDDVEYVTRLPSTQMGRAGAMKLRELGVGTDYIIYGGDRIGVYYFEEAASLRNASVGYDRANSAYYYLEPGMIDWRTALKDAQVLHVSGITAAITNLASSVTVIVMNQYLAPLGDEKIAALGIVLKVVTVATLVLVGFSFGGVPMFGYLFGAGDFASFKKLLRFCTLFIAGLGLVISIVVFLAASPLIRVFLDTASIVPDGTLMLRWQISGLVFASIVLLYTCVFQATGKALPALVMSLSRQGLVFLGIFFTLTLIFGYQGFLASQAAADLVSAVLALGLYVRMSKSLRAA